MKTRYIIVIGAALAVIIGLPLLDCAAPRTVQHGEAQPPAPQTVAVRAAPRNIFEMTQAERKAASLKRKADKELADNLARDPIDRAKAVCALAAPDGLEPVGMYDWEVTQPTPGAWRVAALFERGNRKVLRPCTLTRGADGDLVPM